MSKPWPHPRYGGVVHTYLKYDPQRFPLPDAAAPDLVSPAFEHLLAYGSMRRLTPEELADAIHLDPSQIAGLGPSLEALRAMLEERKRRIIATYETDTVRGSAEAAFRQAAGGAHPPKHLRAAFDKAIRSAQIPELERLWYRIEERREFSRDLMRIIRRLGDRLEIEELAAKYAFTGRQAMDIPKALEIKEELETIDRLLKQLEEAAKNARIGIIDMEALAEYADPEQLEALDALQRQVNELLEQMAREQGLISEHGEFRLSPKAFRVFQGRLLEQIFSELAAARSGRHHEEISGDGAVELSRTKPYEFGDSLANMDVTGSMLNAMARGGAVLPVRMRPDDIEIHLTRNNPKCATVVVMDMSGSMLWDGAYIHVKRMALALHGLIRTEYPGDFLDFIEMATLCKRRAIGEIPELLPKPVTIRNPVVRLRADLSDERFSELALPPHFTNIQQGLSLARQVLQVQDTPNRQIILITDGLPTAHFEGPHLYMLYPPDERTARQTLREGLTCKQQGITINIFLLSSWSQTPEDVRFAHVLAESTSGRVFFTAGGDLERFVVWDYVKRRRLIIG
jgi:uncharacterized protein with von Willebrand factor type A (vWA) domain